MTVVVSFSANEVCGNKSRPDVVWSVILENKEEEYQIIRTKEFTEITQKYTKVIRENHKDHPRIPEITPTKYDKYHPRLPR